MSFRAHTELERLEIIERITSVIELMAVQRQYLIRLEAELMQGVWQSDIDWAGMPLPEPACYLCTSRAFGRKCSLSHEYGTVCLEYQHFSRRVSRL